MRSLRATMPFSLQLLFVLFIWLVIAAAFDKSCGAQELPDAPSKKMRAIEVLALSGSAAFDIETTVRGYPGGFSEANPFLRALGGPQPSRTVMYSAIGALDTGVYFGTDFLRRRNHPKLARTLLWGAVAVHMAGGIKNLVDQYNQPPSPPGFVGNGK